MPSGRQFLFEYDVLGRTISKMQLQGIVPLLHSWYKYDDANRVAEQYYRVNPSMVNLAGLSDIFLDNARGFVYTYDAAGASPRHTAYKRCPKGRRDRAGSAGHS